MNRFLISLLALFWSCCAVNAQGVPNMGGMGVPSNAPGVQANLSASSNPTVNNDITQGYQVGSLWQNSATGQLWMARSVAAGAASWTLVSFFDHPGYIASNWYVGAGLGLMGTGAAPGAGSIRLYPAYIRQRVTIGSLGLRISTTSAGGNVQAAIYANNFGTMRPTGSALVSTASMSTTTGTNVSAAASIQLNPGLYWFATNCDNATAAMTSTAQNQLFLASEIGSATQGNALQNGIAIQGLSVTQTFGTWPDLTSASFTEVITGNTIPIVQFQVTSVP